jgi:GTP-binding protein HflX
VSAVRGEGVDALLAAVAALVDEAPPVDVVTPAGEGAAVAWLYRHGRVIERAEAEDGGVRLSVSLTAQALGQFEQLYPQARVDGR